MTPIVHYSVLVMSVNQDQMLVERDCSVAYFEFKANRVLTHMKSQKVLQYLVRSLPVNYPEECESVNESGNPSAEVLRIYFYFEILEGRYRIFNACTTRSRRLQRFL
jgi:hypothetical protein